MIKQNTTYQKTFKTASVILLLLIICMPGQAQSSLVNTTYQGIFNITLADDIRSVKRFVEDAELTGQSDRFMDQVNCMIQYRTNLDTLCFWSEVYRREEYTFAHPLSSNDEQQRRYDPFMAGVFLDVIYKPIPGWTEDAPGYTGKINVEYLNLELSPEHKEKVATVFNQGLDIPRAKPEQTIFNETIRAGLDTLQRILTGYELPRGSLWSPTVTFTQPKNKTTYGYDHFRYQAHKGTGLYEQYTLDGKHYEMPWFSVPTGQPAVVQANISSPDTTFNADTIRFRSSLGMNIIPESSPQDSVLYLSIQGRTHEQEQVIEAFIPYVDSTGTQQEKAIGQCKVITYNSTAHNLVVVPLNNATAPAGAVLEGRLNDIYKTSATEWVVSIDDPLNIPRTEWDTDDDNALDYEAFGRKYCKEMRRIYNYYEDKHSIDKNTYYLFLVPEPLKDDYVAYMPLKGQFAFISTGEVTQDDLPRILAHELGHGSFRLYHTFSDKNDYPAARGTTDNLMDYNNGSQLHKYQWDYIKDPRNMIFAGLKDEEEGAAFGIGTKALCIKEDDALQKLSKYNVFYLPDGRIVDLKSEYKVSGFFTKEDAVESARGAIFSLKINGYDNKHVYSGKKSVGFGYKKNDETIAMLVKVEDMTILETSDNAVRVFIDKSNKSIQVKSKTGEILETISFNGECNCTTPEKGFETYFVSGNVSQSYINYFNDRSQKIDNTLHEDTELINQLVEKVNAGKDNNNKDEHLLGVKLADKLKTFELFNNRKFIVAPLSINTLCTNQNTWNTIAKKVYEKAGLPDDAILITIPYVHCSGVGPDLGEYYFMPGIAFGSNTKIELSKLRTDYSNTQRVAKFATHQKFPVGEFIEDVFTNTYKKAVVYRGIYNGSNAIEAVKYEKGNVTGLPFNKTIELYRQQEYTKLAAVVKDWKAANKGLLDVYKTGKLSAYDYANQLRFTDFEYRKKFAEVLEEVSQAGGLEKFTPSSDNLFIYKEEFIESAYGNNEEINAIHYIKNRAFKELQVELNYPYSRDFDYSADLTLNRDFWTDHVDPVVYTTLDVTSVALGIIVPGADIFPESIGLFYSAARLNVERTVAYSIAVAIPTSMGNPIVVNGTFKQFGAKVFKIVRRENVEVTENAADDLLLDFVEKELKGNIDNAEYLTLKSKLGEELKSGINNALNKIAGKDWITIIGKNIDDITEAPSGYQFYNYNGKKFLRRLDASNVNTPRLAIKNKKVVKYDGQTVTSLTSKQVENLAISATKNPTEGKVMLGRYDYDGVSYVTEAGEEFIYYNLDNWDDIFKLTNESVDEMWRINEEFITKQFNKNNPFYFSHNPNSRDVIEGKYLEQEIELLKKLVKEKYGKTAEFNPTGKYWKLEW